MKNRGTTYNSSRYKTIIVTLWAAYMVSSLALYSAANQAPFDFDLFLSELESALAKIEDEEKGKTPEGQPSSPTPAEESSTPPPHSLPNAPAKITSPGAETRDPASLFLDPVLETVTPKDSKKRASPTKESLAAYNTVMNEFTNHLSSIKRKIPHIRRFSPNFKEDFVLSYQHLIDAIVIANQQIKSKKSYLQLFLAPPETSKQLVGDMKKLRKMILDTAEKIKKLDAMLTIKPGEEETESSESLLRTLAVQYQDTDLQPEVPPQKMQIKKRNIIKQKAPEQPLPETKKE